MRRGAKRLSTKAGFKWADGDMSAPAEEAYAKEIWCA